MVADGFAGYDKKLYFVWMKRIFILSVAAFAFLSSFGQITSVQETEIGKVRRMTSEFIWLVRSVNAGDTTYILRYASQATIGGKEMESIPFKGASTVNDLYKTLQSAFPKSDREKTAFVLGSVSMRAETERHMGVRYVTLYTDNSRSVVFTEKELNKLFGR